MSVHHPSAPAGRAPRHRATAATYWNEALETIDRTTQRALETRRLRRQLAYTARTSPFYRAKWARTGTDVRRVRDAVEIADLPFTEKAELQAAQDEAPPFGTNACAPMDRLVRMQATGGTTSRPMRMALTRRDVAVYNEIGARAAWAAGLRPGDLLFECMNYAMYAGGVNDHMTFETLGACVAPVGVGQSKRLLQILGDAGTDAAIYSTPSYALHLAGAARAEGVDPERLRIRKGLFSGDAGLEVGALRQEIETTFGMVARNIYGTSETAPVAAECDEADGLHFVGQGAYLAELIDVDGGAVIEAGNGVVGELVLTTLEREAHPLIRMRTHDHVRVTTSPCACGRTGFRFQLLGRSDDMFIVRGINVYPLAVGTVVDEFRPEVNGELQVVLRDAPPHRLAPLVRVALAEPLPEGDRDRLIGRITDRIHELLVFSPDVELVEASALPRSETKSRRIVRTYREAAHE